MKKTRQIISILLAVLMIISIGTAAVYADGEDQLGKLTFFSFDENNFRIFYALDDAEKAEINPSESISLVNSDKIRLWVEAKEGYEFTAADEFCFNVYSTTKEWTNNFYIFKADVITDLTSSSGYAFNIPVMVDSYNETVGDNAAIETIVLEFEHKNPAAPPAEAGLNITSATLDAGKTAELSVSDGEVDTWLSSDTAVATVKDGKVTALKKGKANIYALLKDNTYLTCEVTVKSSPKLAKTNVIVKKGKTVSVKITGKASAVKNVYKNTKIAKITSKNTASKLVVKGLKKGSTTLSVTVNGAALKLKVTVK